MEVKKTFQDPDYSNHSIEWGYATWTKELAVKEKSIRNRYNKDDGGFNYAGSAEIPWKDFNVMILESIKNKKFSKEELFDIISEVFRDKNQK